MALDYIDFLNDSQLLGGTYNGTDDVTLAIKKADDLARAAGIRKIKLPTNKTFVVSASASRLTVASPSYANQWLGDMYTTVFKLKAGAPQGAAVTMWVMPSITGAKAIFALDGNAAAQMQGLADHDAQGNLIGYRSYGMRCDADDAEIHLSVFNTRSISATGYGSTFAFRSGKCIGGTFELNFETNDGSIGSESAVFQGKTMVPGAQANPWTVTALRSVNMWRGMGCFGGGWGVVNGLYVQDCTGPADKQAPGGKISGNACNIESGFVPDANGNPIPNSSTKSVVINNPVTVRCDRMLVSTNNYGEETGSIVVNNGLSTNDKTPIVFGGNGVAGEVKFNSTHFEAPTQKIITGNASQRTNLAFTTSTYNCPDNKVGVSPIPSGLTRGTGPASNSAPSITAMIPADGAIVTSGAVIPVEVSVTDDKAFSALTASGQAYQPAVNITSFTVSGTTATVDTDTAHNLTSGGAVRVKNMTPGVLNGKWTNATAATSTQVTFTVPNGTPNGTTYGTLEPVGAAIPLTAFATEGKFKGSFTAPASDGQIRRLEVIVNDNDPSGSLSDTAIAIITTDSLSIDTASPLTGAIIGSSYTATITGSGGTGSPTWAVTGLSGHGLSSATVSGNLVISATTITGTDGDTLTFTVSLTKSGVTTTKQFTIEFSAPAATDTDPPDVTEISLPDGTIITALTRVTALISDASGLGASPKVRLTAPDGTVIELTMAQ